MNTGSKTQSMGKTGSALDADGEMGQLRLYRQ